MREKGLDLRLFKLYNSLYASDAIQNRFFIKDAMRSRF